MTEPYRMTVGDLRERLARLPADWEVKIRHTETDYGGTYVEPADLDIDEEGEWVIVCD